MNYDIIVIGAGSAGLNIASFFNRINLSVLMIEKHLIGGDCLNTGCVPSKALIHLAHIAHAAKQAKSIGLEVKGKVDLKTVAKTISQRQDIFRVHENPEYFRKKGIHVEIGDTKFLNENTIEINGKKIQGKKFVLATGSTAFIPPIPGLKETKFLTNETIFENTTLPENFLIVGAGPIGVEIAQSYQRLGSNVTIIARDPRLLPREEKEVSMILQDQFEEEGIKIHLGVDPIKFEKNKVIIKYWNPTKRVTEGKEREIQFDQVLIATGRQLNTQGMDLEKGGVELKNNRLVIDNNLRTTNKNIYACGDVAGGFQFTHWAEYQAGIVIKNLLSPLKKSPDDSKIAWTTYTDPQVATFGLQLPQIKEKYEDFKKIEVEIPHVDRAITEGEKRGLLKIYLVDSKIVGGTMIGKDAGEITSELILMMTLGIKFDKLFDRIFPYPTMARANRSAVQQYLGEKLTPRNIKILNKLFQILS